MEKTTKLLLSLVLVLLFCSSIYLQTSDVYAVGSSFEEGTDGFSVTEGDVLSYAVTVVNTGKGAEYGWSPFFGVGDKFQTEITTCNNTYDDGVDVEADVVYGYYNFFDFSTFSWSYDVIGGREFAIAFYNSTHELDFPISDVLNNTVFFASLGLYSFLYLDAPHMDVGVRNFTALNQSIVNITYTMALSLTDTLSFSHSEPDGTVAGTWTLSLGNYDDDYAFRFQYTFNGQGICTLNRMYFNGTSGWTLVYESTLETSLLALLLSYYILFPQPNQTIKYILYAVFGVGAFLAGFNIYKKISKNNKKGKRKKTNNKDIESIRTTILALILLALVIFSITDNVSQILFSFIQQLLNI